MKLESVGYLGLAHHFSFLDLQTAAKNCDVCALIEQSVDGVSWLSKKRDGEDGFSVWSMAAKSEEAYLVGAVGMLLMMVSSVTFHKFFSLRTVPGRIVEFLLTFDTRKFAKRRFSWSHCS